MLPVALLAACGLAALAGGAVAPGDLAWLQAGLAATGLATAAALAAGRLRVVAPRAAWVGLGLLAASAAWTALSLTWSVAPDRTWTSLNRALAYLLLAGLAVAAGSSSPRAVARVATGWLAVSCGVALVALTGRLGDAPAATERLREPLEYWNALAVVCAFGVPAGVRLAADAARALPLRLAGLSGAWLLLVVLGLTYSRGGVLALAVAIAVLTALGPERMRVLSAAGAAALAAAPVLALAFARDAHGAGLVLALLLCGSALVAGGRWALRWEPRVPAQALGLAARAALVAAVLALVAGAATDRGLDGAVRAAADGFTQARGDAIGDPSRLADAGGGNRWIWWGEAAGAWADRPLGGWGAGSFAVTHRLFREEAIDVAQPHSVPLQWLAETGLAGLLLTGGGLLALGAAAAAGRPRAPRDGAALLALAAAGAVHGLVDWDWDIPAVVAPVLVALGVLAGRPADPRAPRRLGAFVDAREGGGGRWAGLVAATVALALVAVSGALPALSDARTGDALVAAGRPGDRARAAARAELAARLDPLAVRPLLAVAAIEEGRGRPAEARAALERAVRRQPWSAQAWLRLAESAALLGDRAGAARAARRALALDPLSEPARLAALATTAELAPAEASPGATGTPLAPPAP